MRKIWIYTIAIAPFFTLKDVIERHLGTPLFLVVAVAVALAARAVAERFGRDGPLPGKRLSTEEARGRFADLARDSKKLIVVLATCDQDVPENLGPATRDFFAQYENVRSTSEEIVVSVAEIRPSDIQRFWSIGHCEDCDIVQLCGSDEVFVLESGGSVDDELTLRYPSIYHLFVDTAE